MKSVYWDANIFHALFGAEAGRIEACNRIYEAARNGEVIIYTSAITCVECVWIKGNPDKLSPRHEAEITRFFEHKFIRIVQCTRLIAEQARGLIWKYPHLKPKDALHVATAIKAQVNLMHSYDNDDLVKLDGQIGNPPLKICNPGNGDGFEPAEQTDLPIKAPPPRRRINLEE
ncbi:MAG TPA: PIN domain-containing protein [Verrucomicrobiae bacterium]|jgi:hypothetical protein|nr:PIN domain-containing protein [Verrucomicrobiae bacterium]